MFLKTRTTEQKIDSWKWVHLWSKHHYRQFNQVTKLFQSLLTLFNAGFELMLYLSILLDWCFMPYWRIYSIYFNIWMVFLPQSQNFFTSMTAVSISMGGNWQCPQRNPGPSAGCFQTFPLMAGEEASTNWILGNTMTLVPNVKYRTCNVKISGSQCQNTWFTMSKIPGSHCQNAWFTLS